MTNRHDAPAQAAPRGVKVMLALMLSCLVLAGLLFLAMAAYLESPDGAHRAGRLLSGLSPCPVTLQKLRVRPWSLVVEGVSVASPPSWGRGDILTIRRLEMVPNMPALLTGKRRLRSLDVQGASLVLARNRGGAWNVAEVLRGLPPRKHPAPETFIRRLSLRDCSVTVEGRRFVPLDATLTDISTTGAVSSRIDINATPPGGDPLRIVGMLTPGPRPGFQVTLAAPKLPLAMVTALSPGAASLFRHDGSFGLSLDARLAGSNLSLAGAIPFTTGFKAPGGGSLPLEGSLTFAAHYDQKEDRGVLQRCSLVIRNLLQLEGRGEVSGARGPGRFRATASMTEVSLVRLWPLAPEALRRRLSAEGTLSLGELRMEGDRRSGVTSAGALLQLRHGALKDGTGPLLTGLSARITALRKQGAWHLDGLVSQEGRTPGLAITALRATLAARLPNDRKHPTFDLSTVTGTFEGAPLTGHLLYHPGDKVPLSGGLTLEAVPLVPLNRFLPPTGPRFSAGTASLDLRGSGQDQRHLGARLDLRLEKPEAALNDKKFTAQAIATQAHLMVTDGTPSFSGFARLQEGSIGGKPAAATLSYAVADNTLRLWQVEGSVAGASIRMETLTARLPSAEVVEGMRRLPLQAAFQGLALQQGDLKAEDISGNLDCLYRVGNGKRWLEGAAQLLAPHLSLGGRKVAAVTGRLLLSPGDGTLHLTGSALGGQLSATAKGDPLAMGHHASFSLDLKGMQGAELTAALGKRLPVAVGRGTLSASSSGSFSTSAGLRCTFAMTATDLALMRERKTLVSRGSLILHGSLDRQRLSVDDGKVGFGEGISARVTAEVNAPASPARKGTVRFLLPPTAVSSLLDSLANALPPMLQEASADGTLGLAGELRIDGQTLSLDGDSELAGVVLEIPAQKLIISGVNGTVPFSLARPAPSSTGMSDPMPLRRQDYPGLHRSFSAPSKGEQLQLERIKLGDLELANTKMVLVARDGTSSITSLQSQLYGGSLFARGFLRYGSPPEYGVNLLLFDLSLQRLCDSVPAIRGYLSGRLDGVGGIFSEGGPQGRLAGNVELWTRPGSGEKMLVSKEFLQKLAGKNLKGLFFQSDRPYDRGELSAFLEGGYLTFDRLDISHTNLLGVRDLSVTVVPVQNRIALGHLLQSIRDAAARGKGKGAPEEAPQPPPESELLWLQ